MANPRQRRKARSTHKPVHHSRQAKKLLKKQPPIRGPRVLQDAWDKHKTVRQNYAALGLAVSLNPNTSGGTEHPAAVTEARRVVNGADFLGDLDPAVSTSGGRNQDLPIGLGRIVRDEAGRIIAVETNDNVDRPPPNDPLHLVDEAANRTPESQSWISFGRTSGANSELIQPLCDVFRAPVPRFTSKGEMIFLQKLLSKHGRDVEAMTRDRKLNPYQRTEGEIRRAFKIAGGFEKVGAQMS